MSEDRPGRDGKSPSWLEGGFHLETKGRGVRTMALTLDQGGFQNACSEVWTLLLRQGSY